MRHFLTQIPGQYADVKNLASKKILLMKPGVYVSKSLCISKDFFQEIAWQVTGKRKVAFKEREYACFPQVLQAIAQFEDEVSHISSGFSSLR